MKYLADHVWASLPTTDFRPRFFIETYLEKLSMNTPHFFQARLMNVISSCREAITYVAAYEENEKNSGYLRSAIEEIENSLEKDPIAKNLFKHLEAPLRKLFSEMRGEAIQVNHLQRLTVICRAITSRETEYEGNLLAELRAAILNPVDLSQKQRVTESIYQLTSLYTTQLLNKGYSPTYLFTRAEMFTRISNYSSRTFAEQFDLITERLVSRISSFEVYLGLTTTKPSSLLTIPNDPEFQFLSNLPPCITGKELGKFNKGVTPNLIAKTIIDATDYVTAAWKAKDKLDKFLDAFTALELNPNISTTHSCAIVQRSKNLTHTKTLNIDRLISFLASEGGTYFKGTNTTIRSAMSVLNKDGKENLGRSLRYLRLAREAVSFEQKLLNLWISLESLFSASESGILPAILGYAPQIYAISSIRRRVLYLRDLLAANSIGTTPLVQGCTPTKFDQFSSSTTEADIYALLKNELAAIELFNSLGNKEHLKYKLLTIFEELKSNSNLLIRLEKSEKDVARQLRRIYFLRNKMAHAGHYENIRPQLVIHLLDYVAVCYMAICSSAQHSKIADMCTVGDLLAGFKMGIEVVISEYKTAQTHNDLEKVVPQPIA